MASRTIFLQYSHSNGLMIPRYKRSKPYLIGHNNKDTIFQMQFDNYVISFDLHQTHRIFILCYSPYHHKNNCTGPSNQCAGLIGQTGKKFKTLWSRVRDWLRHLAVTNLKGLVEIRILSNKLKIENKIYIKIRYYWYNLQDLTPNRLFKG